MRRVIKIGLLLVLAAVVVGLGIGRAQRAAEKSSLVAVPAASATAAAPSNRPAAVDAVEVIAQSREGTPAKILSNVPKASVVSGKKTGDPGLARDPMATVPMSGMMTLPFYGAPGDPEVQKLSGEIQKTASEEQSLLAQYAAATNERERNRLKESLSKLLDRHFELQQQLRKRELDPIEARVKRLRELIEKRNQARKTIVEKRLDQLLRDAEGMGWAPPAQPVTGAGLSGVWAPSPDDPSKRSYYPRPLYDGGPYKKAEPAAPVPAPMVAPNQSFNPFGILAPRRSAPESSQVKGESPSDSAAKGSAAPANGAARGSQVPDQAKTEALQPAEKGPAAPASAGSGTGAGHVAAGLMSRAEAVAVPRSQWTTPPSVTAFAPPSDDASVLYAITLQSEQAVEISGSSGKSVPDTARS